jgi:hypothetical protein
MKPDNALNQADAIAKRAASSSHYAAIARLEMLATSMLEVCDVAMERFLAKDFELDDAVAFEALIDGLASAVDTIREIHSLG